MPDSTTNSASTNTAAVAEPQAAVAAVVTTPAAVTPAQPVAAVVETKRPVVNDQKPTDAKATEIVDTKPVEIVYDLKLAKDSKLGQPAIDHATALAKDLKLSPEQAQRILDEQGGMLDSLLQVQADGHAQLRKQWVEEAKADKEIGGQAFDASVNRAKQAFAKFGTPAFEKIINESGFGDHPEVLRVFSRIGKAMGEDSFASSNGTAVLSEDAKLRAMYPSMFANQAAS